MDDFNVLAAALGADVDGVRASLILSRDGLVVGAHPHDGEALAKPIWTRFANLGDPERGFLQFGTSTWCFVRRGPYAAFVVASSVVRPGLVMDQMERVLVAAEDLRADRGSLNADAPEAAAASAGSLPEGAAEGEATTESGPGVPGPERGGSAARRRIAPSMWATDPDGDDVDRYSLAREFGRLLQDDGTDADG